MRVGEQSDEALVGVGLRDHSKDGLSDGCRRKLDGSGGKCCRIASYILIRLCIAVDGSLDVALRAIGAVLDEVGNVIDLLSRSQGEVEARGRVGVAVDGRLIGLAGLRDIGLAGENERVDERLIGA